MEMEIEMGWRQDNGRWRRWRQNNGRWNEDEDKDKDNNSSSMPQL